MSQPVAIATLALAIAAVLTAAIVIATLATEAPNRAIKVTALGAIVASVIITLQRADLRINFTGSMPIGIYLLAPMPHNGAKRGMLVVVCAPARAAVIGLRRGYLARGPCFNNTELLLKSIAAIAGDAVNVTAAGVLVDSCLLPHSRPIARDQSGRKLVPWPLGYYRLRQNLVWLYASNDRSWDSRYWGPLSLADIYAEAMPLLVAAGAFRKAQHQPHCGALPSDP
jgi:conjugative transfer signal peptidase TraF